MAERRYLVGERVLVSRDESGEGHEEATVVDYYVLLMEGDSIPSIVVDFDDGERKYLTAREPNVLPIEDDEPEDGELAGDEAGQVEAEATGSDADSDPARSAEPVPPTCRPGRSSDARLGWRS